jgi:hypothetical protein
MRIVGRGYPSGTGRIFGRLKAVASIGDRSKVQYPFGTEHIGWGVLGTGPRLGVGDGSDKSAGQKAGDWHLIEGPRQGARPTLPCK